MKLVLIELNVFTSRPRLSGGCCLEIDLVLKLLAYSMINRSGSESIVNDSTPDGDLLFDSNYVPHASTFKPLCLTRNNIPSNVYFQQLLN